MFIEIEINCDDERELLAHLSVIRQQIKKEWKKHGEEIKVPATLTDSNCYGDHTVNIIPECDEQHFPDGNGFCLSCGAQLGVKISVA